MNRPKHQNFKKAQHINDYPLGPSFDSGFLADTNAGWRTFRPEINDELCVKCLRCYLVCPDGTVFKEDNKMKIDFDYCKGCGVCAYECPKKAIKMIKEEL